MDAGFGLVHVGGVPGEFEEYAVGCVLEVEADVTGLHGYDDDLASFVVPELVDVCRAVFIVVIR